VRIRQTEKLIPHVDTVFERGPGGGANPVLRMGNTTRDYRSYQAVGCNHTNSSVLDTLVTIDPAFYERATGATATHYDNSDHSGPNGPTVIRYHFRVLRGSVFNFAVFWLNSNFVSQSQSAT
jgi:hypothetical protein